jgi:hypothetical protein
MFQILDGRNSFFQWDKNQKLIVADAAINEVHFCNKTDDCSLVCEVYELDGQRVVDVPNILFQKDWTIRAYAYQVDKTLVEQRFKVITRSKPSDYIYTETEVKNYEELEARVKALEENNGEEIDFSNFITSAQLDAKGYQSAEQVNALINEALEVIENGTY